MGAESYGQPRGGLHQCRMVRLAVALLLGLAVLLALGAASARAESQAPEDGASFVAGNEIDFVVRGGGPSPSNPSFVPDLIYVGITSEPTGPTDFIGLAGFSILQIQASYVGPVQGGGGGIYVARWTPSINQAPGTYWWQAQRAFALLGSTRTLTLVGNPNGLPAPRAVAPADGSTIVAGPNVTFVVEAPAVPSPFLNVRVSRSPVLGPDGTLATVSEPVLPYGIQVGDRIASGGTTDLWQAGKFWFTSIPGGYIPEGTYYWQPVLSGQIPLDADRQVAGPVYRFTLARPAATPVAPPTGTPASQPAKTPPRTTTLKTPDPRCRSWRKQLRTLPPKLKIARRLASKAPTHSAKRRAQVRVRDLAAQRTRLAKQVAAKCS